LKGHFFSGGNLRGYVDSIESNIQKRTTDIPNANFFSIESINRVDTPIGEEPKTKRFVRKELHESFSGL